MDTEGIMISEIVRHRKINKILFHLHVESNKSEKKLTNITKQKLSHRCREQTGGCQRGS